MCLRDVQRVSYNERRRASQASAPGQEWRRDAKLELTVRVPEACSGIVDIRVLLDEPYSDQDVPSPDREKRSERDDSTES